MGALGKKLRIQVQAQLQDIHCRMGTTFVDVIHDQKEALPMSDRIVITQNGRVEQVGTSGPPQGKIRKMADAIYWSAGSEAHDMIVNSEVTMGMIWQNRGRDSEKETEGR